MMRSEWIVAMAAAAVSDDSHTPEENGPDRSLGRAPCLATAEARG